MAIEIVGKLLQLLPLQSGTGSRGDWTKQDFVIETIDQYPKKICVSAWGDKARDLDGINTGDTIKISVNIESREYSGRWYTDVRAWRIERENSSQQPANTQTIAPAISPSSDDYSDFGATDVVDDLPF